MSTRSTSSDGSVTRALMDSDYEVDKYDLTKKMLMEQKRKLRERDEGWNRVMDTLEQQIDAQTKEWEDAIVRLKENPEAEQLAELQKSLLEEEVKDDPNDVMDVKKSLRTLGYKAKHTGELVEDVRPIQSEAAREARQLSAAVKRMTAMETKHQEMLSKWTETPLGREEAKKMVLNYLPKLKGEKGLKLAEDIKKFVQKSAGTSGARKELPLKPNTHTVYVPSSAGAGASTSGFHYKKD